MLWNAQCMGCEAASGVCDSVVMAAASWNTRAESADLTAALAENEALRSRAMSDPLLAATFKHMEAAIKRRDEVIEELFVIFKCAGYWRNWVAAKLKEVPNDRA
jgi:hypothetical protein